MKKILVVDDEPDTVAIVKIVLEEEGYMVSALPDPTEFKTVLRESKTDLVLLDHKLAAGSGSDLCLAVKSNPLTSHIPVILVSASSSIAMITDKCNADGFLSKPFDLGDLIALVKDHCKTAIH